MLRRLDQTRCEALHPPVDGDVVNLDAALGEKFFHIAIGQAVAGLPADSQQDRLGPEAVPGKRSGLTWAVAIHQNTFASGP